MSKHSEFENFLDDLKKKNPKLAEKMEKLYKVNLDFFKQSPVFCPNCGKENPIYLWVFIQDVEKLYVKPAGDPVSSELDDERCHLICPNCNSEISIYHHPQKISVLSSIQFLGREKLFAKVIKREKPVL
ncbi:MAG: hypothetical protein M1334_00050 [Patescibacteria group bacterium]|nr:hypothetical protein [Patescibacteria group bacterium]